MALGLTGATMGAAQARDGCGPGFHRGFYGYCRPNFGPPRLVYRPGFYGYRRFGWHRWGGYRHVGWHHGWHRRW
ncbi:hypothetical protein Q8W67_13965 [Methylobacterium sp. NEAU K]|nr:hypothetical protein [Methylobacterium sp. NEAU K]MDP4004564.1 hypothetical protein [Methylobacterium sp. NEAU K]